MNSPRARLWVLAATTWLFISCASSGTGCGGLQSPIPSGPFPEAQKTENVANLRLTQSGIDFLNQNWAPFLNGLLPDGGGPLTNGAVTISLPVGCKDLSGVIFGDQGHPAPNGTPCNDVACGREDEFCDLDAGSPTFDAPLSASASITAFHLDAMSPDQVTGTLSLSVDTGTIFVADSCIHCGVDFNDTDAGAGSNRLQLTVQFSVLPQFNNKVSFQVTQLDGLQVCGSSGAPPAPDCLDSSALHIFAVSTTPDAGANTCSQFVCTAAQEFTSDFLGFLSPFIHDAVITVVNYLTCEPCGGASDPACPGGSFCSTSGVCLDNNDTSVCVPRFVGLEGRASLSSFLDGYGVPPDAQMDLSLGLGSSANVDAGVNLGMRGGVLASQVNACVAPQPVPQLPQVPSPNLDRDSPDGGAGYHLGIALSQPFLGQALFHAEQSGALCLNLGTASIGLINTGLFKTFLPSLGLLATRDGKDAPMLIALRPGQPPTVAVGAGTYDPATKKPIDPLVTIKIPDLSIDFYAQLDDRLARLFTLTADVQLPLSLIIDGCNGLEPAFGDLQQLVTNIRTSNAELLAEDPSLLADLVPLALGIAEPALGSLIKPIALPPLGNFKLQVNAIKGINQNVATGEYYHLGIYGSLVAKDATCAVAAPRLVAELASSEIPPASAMRLTGKPLPWPAAVLRIDAEGPGPKELAWKIDDGLWSDFVPESPDGRLRVSHPALLLQGTHRIYVRARFAGARGISSPVEVPFLVDWDPPEVHLAVDRVANRIRISARDVITPKVSLEYAYQVGEGALGEWGPPREIDLAAVEAAGGVTVRVRDQAGNVGVATWQPAKLVLHAASPTFDPQTAGCSAGGIDLLGLIALAGFELRRRRKRS